MAKKTFTDKIQQKANPTLQFIYQPQPYQEDQNKPKEFICHPEPYQRPQDKTQPVEESPERTSSTPKKRTQARRAQPQFDEETKSRRLQLLITPSLYEAIKAKATQERRSINDLINSILSDAVRK